MGWLVRNNPLPSYETTDSYLRAQVTSENDDVRHEIIDSAFVGATWYAALRATWKTSKADYCGKSYAAGTTYVVALVFLTSGGRARFGYKDMEESMGPCETECPTRILNLLTPFEQIPGASLDPQVNYAIGWRQKCREHAAAKSGLTRKRAAIAKLWAGAKIRLPRQIHYDGKPYDTFEVTFQRVRRGAKEPSMCFFPIESDGSRAGFLARVTARDLATAEVIAA